MAWEVVIGLEVHAQLTTQSKIFSGASTAFGQAPNTAASLIDLAMPGTLPVLNQAVLEKAVLFGFAVDAKIAPLSFFERKNYFYPDLPKGYQISQLQSPIVSGGHLDIQVEGHTKRIGITRAHLEEDAGKSLHDDLPGMTALDLNRAGTPLLEIVSEPDLRSAAEAVAYLKKLHQLVMWIGVCDGNMQEGSFRCDANVSVRQLGAPLGTRVEIKNLNSFRFIESAINHEVERQIDLIESGGTVTQETRLYDAERDETRSMRSKEEANDYRYFPDPDLLPVQLTDEFYQVIKSRMPELPQEKCARWQKNLGLSDYDTELLTQSRATSEYFDALMQYALDPKLAANWINGEVAAWLNRNNLNIETSGFTVQRLQGLLVRIMDGTLSGKLAKEVFEVMTQDVALMADDVIDQRGLKQVNDESVLEAWVDEVLNAHPEQIAAYQAGQSKMLGFFVGQVMKKSSGKANPAAINTLITQKLSSS